MPRSGQDCFLPDPATAMTERWIRRLGASPTRFRYVDPDGREISDGRLLTRIAALRVPPAWRDVHIAPDARRSVQAWGYDARGRKQYRYNRKAVERRELRKYHRARQLAKSLPRIREMLRTQSRDARATLAELQSLSHGRERETLEQGVHQARRATMARGMVVLFVMAAGLVIAVLALEALVWEL